MIMFSKAFDSCAEAVNLEKYNKKTGARRFITCNEF
jgi:hypothetical protein